MKNSKFKIFKIQISKYSKFKVYSPTAFRLGVPISLPRLEPTGPVPHRASTLTRTGGQGQGATLRGLLRCPGALDVVVVVVLVIVIE